MSDVDLEQHVKILSIINIILGVLGLIGALFMGILFGVLGGVAASEGEAEAGAALGALGGVFAVVVAILALPQLLAGIGLHKRKNWGRILTFIVAALSILNLPIGTAYGIYAFWALTRPGIEDVLS